MKFFSHALSSHVLAVALLHTFCTAAAAQSADAETPPGGFEPQWWLDSGFFSHHTTERGNGKQYRENNAGIGVEWHFKPQWQVNAGHYRNSLSEPSTYLQLGWMPWRWEAAERVSLTAGASVGVVNGYPGIKDKGYFPSLVPVLAAEWRRVGVNLVYVPSVGRIHGAYAAQLKFQMF